MNGIINCNAAGKEVYVDFRSLMEKDSMDIDQKKFDRFLTSMGVQDINDIKVSDFESLFCFNTEQATNFSINMNNLTNLDGQITSEELSGVIELTDMLDESSGGHDPDGQITEKMLKVLTVVQKLD